MKEQQIMVKKPISHEVIYKIMIWIPLGVAALFFVKNVFAKCVAGAVTIGIGMLALLVIVGAMKVRKTQPFMKEFVLSVALPFLIFAISLNSGEAYSDDFPMFLAVIGLTGLYLEPKFTKVQIIVIDFLLIAMYVLHPEKAESQGQFLLCEVIFTLAAYLFCLTIKRGQAFIQISEERAGEAEKVLAIVREMGIELEKDFASSSSQIEDSTADLQKGSSSITQGATEAFDSCEQVHIKIQETGNQIGELNSAVRSFEEALTENQMNVEAMNKQVNSVSTIVMEANDVFKAMADQMNEIASIARQLSAISFNTTILSLNASIEAARAGDAGSGFSVVAERMRELSANSDMFSEKVSEVVKQLLGQVERTANQFSDSNKALDHSEKTMKDLQESFGRLKDQFGSLYGNIERQNNNVNQVDTIFEQLESQVSEMREYSIENQQAVEAIVEAMDIYKGNITRVIENTKTV